MDISELVSNYFYRRVSSYVGDVVNGYEITDTGMTINYLSDGDQKSVKVGVVDLILYIGQYGNR